MINSKKIFNGGINCDDPFRFLGSDESLNIENMRVGAYGEGKNIQLENIPSPELLYYYYPPGNNLCLGRVPDYNKLRILWCNYNDAGNHGIYTYDFNLKVTYLVLLSSQTVDGFNWDKNFRIARNAKIVDNLFLFTDNLNEPRCINIEAGIKLNQPSYVTDREPYVVPLEYNDITLIKKPPIYRLQVAKITDNGFDGNFIKNNAYQFYYRYWYKDYQFSVLSTFSQLVPYNGADELFNAINIQMPFGEDIPNEVQQVDICMRDGNYGKSFVIQSYNKDNYYDAVAISDHNANVTQLGFAFYDNISGVPIDEETANTSFDNVPLLSKTEELAKNRDYLGNNLKGYDTPSLSNLTLTLSTYNTDGAGTFTSQWKYFYLYYAPDIGGPTSSLIYHYAYNATLNPTTYYYDAYHTSSSAPGTVNASDADTTWATETELAAYIQRNTAPPANNHWVFGAFSFFDTGDTTQLIFTVDLAGLQFFKSSSTVKVALAFYDRFRRKCGITRSAEIAIPDRTFDQVVFSSNILWTLNNNNTLTEIPDWAYYYQIYISKNQTESFFVQISSRELQYVRKDQDDTFVYSDSWDGTNTYATAFNLTALYLLGMGYTFQENDLLRIYLSDGTNVITNVITQAGNYVLCTPTDIGMGGDVDTLIEIYSPFIPSTLDPLYENGDMLNIIAPGTVDRQYETLGGSINGDCYAIQREHASSSTYFVEAMSPNDLVWQIWQTDRGWTNFVDRIGQQQKETSIDWSNTYINGTKTNGLNKFGALNTKDIGSSSGSIQKIQLTNKMEEAGDLMLIIAQTEILSAYLQEVQLYTAAQAGSIITTDQVIGTINPMKFSAGTINPESVVEWNGTVWGIDVIRGLAWQYDTNGVVPISYYKMRSYWDKFGKRYIEQGTDAIEDLCGFSYIESCVDPSTGETLFTVPQTETNTVTSGIPVGYAPELPSYTTLPDYASSIQNRFAFYDGNAKTIVYNYEANKWFGAFGFLPDCMEYLGNKLVAWKDGWMYLCNENTTSFNNFFGTQYPQRICVSINGDDPTSIKDLMDIGIEANAIPNYSVAYTEYPNEQITDLTADDYTSPEGVQYARWFRDRLSPNVTGTAIDKMYKGDQLQSATPLIMLEFSEYNTKLQLTFLDIGFEKSKGHTQIQIGK